MAIIVSYFRLKDIDESGEKTEKMGSSFMLRNLNHCKTVGGINIWKRRQYFKERDRVHNRETVDKINARDHER